MYSQQHYNIHTGERPYACKYCERKFTNYPNWLKHTRRRHKVDHKTGEELEVKTSKLEPTSTPAQVMEESPVRSQNTNIPDIDSSLLKPDDISLIQFPISDDKFSMHQQMDLFTGECVFQVEFR